MKHPMHSECLVHKTKLLYIYIYIYLIGSEIKNWMITMITVDGRHPAPGDKCSLFHYLQSLEQNA